MGFTLSFHFHPNDYFSNSVLTKHYSMKCEPDKEDPFSFEGPEIYKCEGCKVNWKEGKNVTVKQVKKKVKKGKDKGKTVTKEVKADSFFLFFTGEEQGDDEEESDDEDDDDDEDEDDDSDDEEVANRPKLKARKGKGGMGGGQEANPE